jgi:iron-regulated transporter 1
MQDNSPTPDDEARFTTPEATPLLRKASEDGHSSEAAAAAAVPPGLATRLYVSHFLSTWNSRVFEFGAVLYLATIFPGTLLPISVYAIVRGVAAIAGSSAVGRYVDTGDRLEVVRVSICTRTKPPCGTDIHHCTPPLIVQR